MFLLVCGLHVYGPYFYMNQLNIQALRSKGHRTTSNVGTTLLSNDNSTYCIYQCLHTTYILASIQNDLVQFTTRWCQSTCIMWILIPTVISSEETSYKLVQCQFKIYMVRTGLIDMFSRYAHPNDFSITKLISNSYLMRSYTNIFVRG